jgi:hypothetical protein
MKLMNRSKSSQSSQIALLLALVTSSGMAQLGRGQTPNATITVTASPTSVKPGGQTTITWTLSGNAAPAALQALPSIPLGWNMTTPAATPALTAVPKQVQCGTATCVIYGQNLLPIPNVAIVTQVLTVPVTATTGTQTATVTGGLWSNTIGAFPTALTVVPVTLTVLPSPYDVNGDGQVTTADITAMALQVANGNCTADPSGLGGPCQVNRVYDEISGWQANGSKP